MTKSSWVKAILSLPFLIAAVFAQSERGTISGSVKDPSGAVVAGARVIVTNTGTNVAANVVTSDGGDFTVPSLVYYSRGHVSQFQEADEAIEYLRNEPQGVVITYTRGYEELKPRLPSDVVILAKRQRFLRRSEVIILGRVDCVAARPKPKDKG